MSVEVVCKMPGHIHGRHVVVKWHDTEGHGSEWFPIEDVQEILAAGLPECTSTGYVLRDDGPGGHMIALAADHGTNRHGKWDYGHVQCIPRGAVSRIIAVECGQILYEREEAQEAETEEG